MSKEGGGVEAYSKENIRFKERKDYHGIDTIIEHRSIEIMDKKDRSLFIGTLYPHSSDPREKLLWIEKLKTILGTITPSFDGTIILTGDRNIDTKKNTEVNQRYLQTLSSFDLYRHI